MNGTTLRVCAGWRLDLLLKGSDMEKLKAKQTVSNLTEAEAIEQAKEGDAAAFEFLYKAHCRRVYSLCLRMIKNPAEAEDLTQQAFLQLFRKIGTFRGESGFSTWLHRVTVNIVLMHIRRHKPAEFPVEDLERYSSNGEGPFEDGSSDTSMLGAIAHAGSGFASRVVRVLRGGRCGVGDRTAVPATSLAVADRSIHPARSPQRHRPVLRVVYARSGYPAVIAAADGRREPVRRRH